MKKLMFAAAALTAGFVMADTVSSDIVGYAVKALDSGKAKMVGSQFQTIGGTVQQDMLLGDLVPNSNWLASDTLKIIADTAAVKYTAKYVTADTIALIQDLIEEEEIEAAEVAVVLANGVGWYTTDNQTFLNNEKIPLGGGYLVFSGKTGAGFTYAGKVITSEDSKITYTFEANKSRVVVNCTPVARKLSDFVPGGNWQNSDTVKIIAETSAVKYTAKYVGADTIALIQDLIEEEEIEAEEVAVVLANGVGWYTTDNQTFLNDEDVPAGEGLLVFCGKTGATLSLPTAL